MLLFDYLLTAQIDYRTINGYQPIDIMSESAVMLVFVWLAIRSRRWWSLVAASSLMLCIMVYLLEWVVPELSAYAADSAQLGLWIVIYLTLLAGVGERWLAGEKSVGGAAVWLRRRSVT